MAELSKEAQAILDAYGDFEAANVDAMAAALRAAAERLGYRIIYGDSDANYIVDVADLLAIAAELEGA